MESSTTEEQAKQPKWADLPTGDTDSEPEYNSDNDQYDWEDPKKLVSKDKDHLIPFDLLDAITKSNFELFFLQKTKYPEQFPIFTDLYNENDLKISKASPLRITEILTYLIIISGLLAFFVRYYSYFNTREAKFR